MKLSEIIAFPKKECEGCGGVYYLNDKRLEGKRDCCPDGKYSDKYINSALKECDVEVEVDYKKISEIINGRFGS